MDRTGHSTHTHRLLAAIVACLLAAALLLLAWWMRRQALRPDVEAYYAEVVVLMLALLAFDAAIHPTARPGVHLKRRGEDLAVLTNALVLAFLAGSIAYTASQQLSSPEKDPRVPGLVVALVTLVINGLLVMGRRPVGRGTRHVRAAVVDMIRRALSSVPILVACIAVLLIQVPQISPIFSLPITSVMVWAGWRIVREHEQA